MYVVVKLLLNTLEYDVAVKELNETPTSEALKLAFATFDERTANVVSTVEIFPETGDTIT